MLQPDHSSRGRAATSDRRIRLFPAPRKCLGLSGFGWLPRAWAFVLLACGATLVAGEPPTLVPPPQELKWSAELPVKLAPDSVAIVLGAQASDPEQQAARLLAEAVMTRFGQHWPVIREGEEQPAQRSLIILGQRTTCRRLDKLCQEQGIDLSNTSPGLDG